MYAACLNLKEAATDLPHDSGRKHEIPILKMIDSLSCTDGMATTPSDITVTNTCVSTCVRTVSLKV